MNLKIGCCGFPVEREDYFKKFKVVEIQETFYQLPSPEEAAEWRAAAPEDFEFTLVAWQLITHEHSSPGYDKLKIGLNDAQKQECGFFRPTDEVLKAWDHTKETADALRARVVLFRCPDSFRPNQTNKTNLKEFFKTIDRGTCDLIWDPPKGWPQNEITGLCEELDLVHCVDPFRSGKLCGRIGYFRLGGIEGHSYRHKGMDMKRLRDFCENEAKRVKENPIYVLFNNASMLIDAMRFEWIASNTGPIRDLGVSFLAGLCKEIEAKEEDEKVQRLSREAEKIVSLILHTEYKKVDIEIEKEKLRQMCKELFPDKEHLYDMIYGGRFDRLWEQFRGTEQ